MSQRSHAQSPIPLVTHVAPVTIVVPAAPLAPLAPAPVISATMSESNSVDSSFYCSLPILSCDNFNDWKIQVIAYLTGIADHVRVISRCPNAAGVVCDLVCPTNAAEAAKWDASECMALGVIMSTASKLHGKIMLQYSEAAGPVFGLWDKISSMHQSRDVSLHHQVWLQFFSTCKNADESYSDLS